MNNLKQKLYDLKQQQKGQLDKISAFIEADDLGEGYEAANKAFDELETKIKAVETQITRQSNLVGMPEDQGVGVATKASVYTSVLKGLSQETVKSFAAGVRKALTEGSLPDGGYTVPEDIMTKIFNLIQVEENLLPLITNTPVTTNSGKRTYKKRAQLNGLQTVAEMAAIPKVEQMQFAQLEYVIAKRAGYMAASVEVLEDSDENLTSHILKWLADEARVTINKNIVNVVKSVETTAISGLDDILEVLTTGLGSALRKISTIHTNDAGLFWLMGLKDGNERPLLQPDPTAPTRMALCVGPLAVPIRVWDNVTLPGGENGTIPFIIGSLKEGVQRFDRKALTVSRLTEATIGDVNLAECDLIAFKAVMRDDYVLRDAEAFKYCELTPMAAG